jgi:hypothetical protein
MREQGGDIGDIWGLDLDARTKVGVSKEAMPREAGLSRKQQLFLPGQIHPRS